MLSIFVPATGALEDATNSSRTALRASQIMGIGRCNPTVSATLVTDFGDGGIGGHASFVFTAVAESKHHISERYIYKI